MNVESLLLGKTDCECKKTHLCPIKEVYIAKGAVREIAKTTKGYKNILLVADENTYAVAGESVAAVLGEKIKKTADKTRTTARAIAIGRQQKANGQEKTSFASRKMQAESQIAQEKETKKN